MVHVLHVRMPDPVSPHVLAWENHVTDAMSASIVPGRNL